MRAIDLVGKVIGRWTVIARGENTRQGGTQWLCRCECGNEKTINGIVLRDGRSKSCGCLHRDSCIERSTKHGMTPMGVKPPPTYQTWVGMKQRCTNPRHKHWKHYGGRGIEVCERWHEFANFLADMGEKPARHSIERREVNGNYEPSNCYWLPLKLQARNKTNSRMLTFRGRTMSLPNWADEIGVSKTTISWRLQEGWTDEQALFGKAGHTS